eukprot:CAMPEP_0116907738 /NCGR_PEP_ID=MMETSP0467-20121206/13286_1 /TAXON_ID=283647 /ORGANISM="Mesodinium pulex, Strain SPMC105" /LENGTH=54 /DNA_ID=CAMNT_0004582817 /DNA_START=666 /DNA_END=830 /DNA_ORIENTATION=-
MYEVNQAEMKQKVENIKIQDQIRKNKKKGVSDNLDDDGVYNYDGVNNKHLSSGS